MPYGLASALAVYQSFIIYEVLCDMLNRYVMVYIAFILMYTWVTTVVQLLFKCYQRPNFCFFVLKFVTHVSYLHSLKILDSYLQENFSFLQFSFWDQ